jgi:hypothetical protein
MELKEILLQAQKSLASVIIIFIEWLLYRPCTVSSHRWDSLQKQFY